MVKDLDLGRKGQCEPIGRIPCRHWRELCVLQPVHKMDGSLSSLAIVEPSQGQEIILA